MGLLPHVRRRIRVSHHECGAEILPELDFVTLRKSIKSVRRSISFERNI
jgi:hypothetical protein